MPTTPDASIVPGRADPEEVARLARRALANPILQAVLESAGGIVMVLNGARQILACNAEFLQAVAAPDPKFHLGARPGEALGCLHAVEGPEGCGTSRACAMCGVALAILESQANGLPARAECSFNLRRNGRLAAVDFEVKATALTLGCHALTVVVFQDITARNRQKLLESIFLHDLTNTLQSLVGWGEFVADGSADPRKAARHIVDLCQRLRHEVAQQRILHDAENGSLAVCQESVPLHGVIEELRDLFLGRTQKEGPHLAIALDGPSVLVRTDHDLLLRVLQNMVLNALEATPQDGTVLVQVEQVDRRIRIHVTNPGVVPEEIASRIFHRSFSTKGPGRGLGTFGMKLIGEDYLGGRLSFHSSPAEGTRFTLELAVE